MPKTLAGVTGLRRVSRDADITVIRFAAFATAYESADKR